MWPAPLPDSSAVDSSFPSPSRPRDGPRDSLHFFLHKDGRKIHVGDCALFKPPQNTPPFIGIIRKITADKEGKLNLGVNWLYRPSNIKLGNGILLEAAPNEVFYSFHKDEIPAGLLLHPCKVAFLHKGAELQQGISSFVCRRLYDTENKCLWWLTDKDYVKDRQEEVDNLLNRSQLKMHGVVQPGGRSPKPLNGPTSTMHIKPSLDGVQNSGSISSQVKGKKRERGDQGSDPSKRERLHKPEDGDSGQNRAELVLKSEISKITDRGGLVDLEGVEKLVQLMHPDSADKRIDLAARILLVDVISATDRSDCLEWFVQHKGLPVLDGWLQEVHKGKFGDGSSPKETDKSVEEYLFALLHALDKLPVNLHALQTCNIGKSVNHLRTHKNAEIQKKARSLVDTWKKRVEAEMNMNDVKSGLSCGVSCSTKPAPSEGSQVGNRKSGGSVDTGIRNSGMQSSASKGSQVKVGSGEGIGKSSASSGLIKSTTMPIVGNSKDQNFRMSVGSINPELPLTPIKEERSSSSSQSQNNSQSCSSDHAKTVCSLNKEDARSSTAGSVSRSSNGSSRCRKSSGVNPVLVSGVQKETGPVKIISSNRNLSSEKSSPTGVSQEELTEVPIVDHGNNQRLIVRLPNAGCSPSRSASGSYLEDPSLGSGKASPAKHENYDKRVRERNEALLYADDLSSLNPDTCQGKDVVGGLDAGNALTACDEKQKAVEQIDKTMESSKGAGSLLAVVPQSGKSCDVSLSSMDALVESCIKFSEASASASPEDDVGMNLLASVAAGEILKSDNLPLPPSPKITDDKLRHTDDKVAQMHFQTNGVAGAGAHDPKVAFCQELKEKCSPVVNASSENLQPTTEVPYSRTNATPGEATCDSSIKAPLKNETVLEGEGANCYHENGQTDSGWAKCCSTPDSNSKARGPEPEDEKKLDYVNERNVESCTAALLEPVTRNTKVDNEMNYNTIGSLLEMDVPEQHKADTELGGCAITEKKPSSSAQVQLGPTSHKLLVDMKAEVADNTGGGAHIGNDEVKVCLESPVFYHNAACVGDKSAREEALGASSSHGLSTIVTEQENETSANSSRCKLERDESDGVDEQHVSDPKPSVSLPGSGCNVKLDFDLNEGFPVDDANQREPTKQAAFGISSGVSLLCPLPLPIPSASGSFSSSITVAAAAKGSFVPPENPWRGKGELGWKGSAATSAFRPAEPRRNLDMPASSGEMPAADGAVSTQSRRPLDFDLNVADEQGLEDVASQSSAIVSCSESGPQDRGSAGLDLDLNRVDENSDAGMFMVSSSSKFEVSLVPSRPSLAVGLSNVAPVASNASRDFDLNSGPGIDEVGAEIASCGQPMKSSLPFPSSMTGVRINGAEFGNFSSWFPPTNCYPAITVPSMFPGRGEQNYVGAAGSQRILASPSPSTSFGLEMYRAPVLPSSPAIPFPSTTHCPYSVFPFDTTSFPQSSSFSGPSTVYGDSTRSVPLCFPTIPSQLVGPSGVITSPYPHPFVMSLPGISGSVGSDGRKWGGQIDLNSGPGGSDSERRDDRITSTVRQHSASGSQLADEHLKVYQLLGGVPTADGSFKRKGPDGGWDSADRFGYKQSSS